MPVHKRKHRPLREPVVPTPEPLDVKELKTPEAVQSAAPKIAEGAVIRSRTPVRDSPNLEMAHVLFIDIVEYSRLSMDGQAKVLGGLQKVVRDALTFQSAQANRKFISLPSGDGMALVFFGDPLGPVHCALAICHALRSCSWIQIRMGMHVGPVYHVSDINSNQNVSGSGINIAQRVMDCGKAGHILVSGAAADVLGQLEEWSGYLHDMGEREVKHGLKIELFNLYSPEFGNPEMPPAFHILPQPSEPAKTNTTRLIVIPFRILRPDPETDFLAFSLPDVITNSLAGLKSLVVRSSMTAARFAGVVDLKKIATEAEVDVALTGTLLRAGDQFRVNAQLVEVPTGTLIWSRTSTNSMGTIFQVQDDIVDRIVESLSLPLTAREHRMLHHDVPENASAYEYYLRANQFSHDLQHTGIARDLYLRCLEEDPHYAPAWARLGRCYRVLGKYEGDTEHNMAQAEAAFRRALDLNPDLAVAHNLYAHLEADCGRSQEALVRLLARALLNPNDPDLFVGLTHICRYCGLLQQSVQAHQRARRLDPQIRTSVSSTYVLMGDYERALDISFGDETFPRTVALVHLGRTTEAIAILRKHEELKVEHRLVGQFVFSFRTLLEGKRQESLAACDSLSPLITRGPEELYYLTRQFVQLGEPGRALHALQRSMKQGFFSFPGMARDPWLDPLRSYPEFQELLASAESRYREALEAFVEAGGNRVLGDDTTAVGNTD